MVNRNGMTGAHRLYDVRVPIRVVNVGTGEVFEGKTEKISKHGTTISLPGRIDFEDQLRFEMTFRIAGFAAGGLRVCGKGRVVREDCKSSDSRFVVALRTTLSCMAALSDCEQKCGSQWVSTGTRRKAEIQPVQQQMNAVAMMQ